MQKKYTLMKSRFDKVQTVMTENKDKYSKYFTPLPYNSGYFMCIELKEGIDAEKARKRLLDQYSTGVISIGNLLRVAFSSVATSQIPQLFENIYQVCQEV